MRIFFRQCVWIVGTLFIVFLLTLGTGAFAQDQMLQPKAGFRPTASGRQISPREVDRLIITPNARRGRQLTDQLERRNDSHLANIATVPLRIERQLSGKAHLIQLDKAVSPEEAQSLAAKLAANPEIESAEPDLLMQAHGMMPNDPG